MKFFNTDGAVFGNDHYYLPGRIKWEEICSLIERKKYFILQGPHKTGKTTSVLEIVKKINAEGKFKALYVNVEPARAVKSDVNLGINIILDRIKQSIRNTFSFQDESLNFFEKKDFTKIPGNALNNFLQFWAQHSSKPVVLFIDEIDSLVGDTLISVLRQIRSGYSERPYAFPQSICLIGQQDVSEYKIWSPDGFMPYVLGENAFSIKAESLKLSDFSIEEIKILYSQHTEQTGQEFTADAIEYVYFLTAGQPWLVNALAYQACFKDILDRSIIITKQIMEKSKESLLLKRDSYLYFLVDRLKEPNICKTVSAILYGRKDSVDINSDNVNYLKTLGLVSYDQIRITNPIYQELLQKEISDLFQYEPVQEEKWIKKVNVGGMLGAFQQLYRDGSDVWYDIFRRFFGS